MPDGLLPQTTTKPKASTGAAAGLFEVPARPKRQPRVADPCIVVIFGGSGDLATRKLLPSFYRLRQAGLLPDQFAIVGFARDSFGDEAYRQRVRESTCAHETAADAKLCDWVSERTYYLTGDAADPNRYNDLRNLLSSLDQKWGTPGNYLFYLATAPSLFAKIISQLGVAGLVQQEAGKWRRVIVEKPFGSDLASAKDLNRKILQFLNENQVYRIDHYLGKETVQNILVLRFSNGVFEPLWNRRHIDHLQITVAECEGVGHRGGYYDHAGALRDMVPNHMMQLISLAAMEPPVSFQADAVRDEQAKLLRAVQLLAPEDVLSDAVRGQYGEGVISGQRVPAYRSEPGVAPDSNTETFVALRLSIDNWRWAGVPFYLRTGKRLPQRVSEISIHFHQAPLVLFRDVPADELRRNVLVLRIQPDERISFHFGVKVPGPQVRIGPVKMDFHYADYFGSQVSTGYERLLYDCMMGDATLFQRADMVEAGWAIVDPVIDVWKALPPRSFPNYPAGTWGPPEAFRLVARDGRNWWTGE